MSSFSERLNQCLDKEGFPPKNRGRIQLLAEMVALTHRGASKWVNGESEPPARKIIALAKKLKVNENWLLRGEGSMTEGELIASYSNNSLIVDVPIYETSSYLSEQKTITKILQCSLGHQGDFFGITLETEAMSPRFPQESIIIFEKTPAKDGDFVLVEYDSFPSPIFRQLLIMGGTFYLNAHNPKFDRLVLNNPGKILGKLIQAIVSFE